VSTPPPPPNRTDPFDFSSLVPLDLREWKQYLNQFGLRNACGFDPSDRRNPAVSSFDISSVFLISFLAPFWMCRSRRRHPLVALRTYFSMLQPGYVALVLDIFIFGFLVDH